MILQQFKAFWEKFFEKKKADLAVPLAEAKVSERERLPRPDELALGYAYGLDEETDEQVVQLKGIDQKFRDTHFYVIGASGTGKTRFLEYLIQQDIQRGRGFGVIDPHGDLIEDVKGWLLFAKNVFGQDLEKDAVLIEPTDPDKTVSFNPLEQIKGVFPEEQAWWDSWGSRMEDILRNSIIALVENNLTLVELPLLLTDEAIRKKILRKVKNPHCLRCFRAYEKVRPSTWREWIESTLNKVDALLADHRMRHIFTSPKSSFNLREIIDNQKVLLVKLEKGRLKNSADLLGSLLLSKIQMAAFSRTDIAPEQRKPFYLYIDEFQNFATQSFIDVLSEARKYGLSLILAHQNLAQLPKELRSSILSNCGVQTCFQVSREDAQIMAKELMTPLYRQPPGWEMNVQNLQELPSRFCFVKNKREGGIILIQTADVLPPWQVSAQAKGELDGITREAFQESVEQSRIGASYLVSRKKVEAEYQGRYKRLTETQEPESFREPKRK
jgi:type IV secretory pathway VirB4 component